MEEKITELVQGSEIKVSRPRERSVSYPAYTLQICLAFTDKIDKEFTAVVYTPKESISKSLGTSGGAFIMQLSSAVQYGLLEQKYGEGYKPTPHYKKIKKPMPNENANEFLLESFQKPELYKKLIAEFNSKQLPSETGLANILDRIYEVKGNASLIAAKVFIKNATALGLVSEGNILKLDTYINFEEDKDEVSGLRDSSKPVNDNPPVVLAYPDVQRNNYQPVSSVGSGTREIPVFLNDKREAKLILPLDFDDEDLKKIVKVLTAYLP